MRMDRNGKTGNVEGETINDLGKNWLLGNAI